MRLLRTLAIASTTAVLLMGQAIAAFAQPQYEPPAVSNTGPARSATAKYHSLTVVKKAGYSILADTAGTTCIADPQMGGAMGVHYVKGDLVKDPAIDSAHPEALVYAPDRHGKLQLAALEYVVIKSRLGCQPPPAAKFGVRTAGYFGTAMALRTRVQLHRRTQPVRSATVLFATRLGLEGQPCWHLRDVEPQRAL
jgi:hypothetical protein